MEIVRLNKDTLKLATEAARLFYWNNQKEGVINDQFFEDNKNIMYVALVGEEVVGNVYGYILPRFDMPKNQLFLYSIDVLEAHQKKGIGKALVHSFLSHLNREEFHNAFVLTNRNNISAMNLYQSTGAEIIHSHEGEDVLFSWAP